MATGLYGLSAYQQTTQTYCNGKGKNGSVKTDSAGTASRTASSSKMSSSAESTQGAKVESRQWSPIDTKSSLVPSVKEGYGMTIGDVELSEKAKDYYDKLKSKFHNSEFILVSKDMKAQVQQNAAAYGNANKVIVLIDEEKLERMATDEAYRKKYEGIIAMSSQKMAQAKNSLTSTGANVKNFGISVNSDGTSSFFATVEKASDAQAKRIEKQAEAKKEQKAREKKKAAKKEKEARLERTREKRDTQKKDKAESAEDAERAEETMADDREYIEIRTGSMQELIGKVQQYAYENSARGVMTDAERSVGQNLDLKF